MYNHFSSAILNEFLEDFICTLLDYHTALHSNLNREIIPGEKLEASEFVSQSIAKCIKENKLIVERLESAFDDIRQSEVAKQVVEHAVTKKKLKLEVIVDNSSKDFDVCSQLKNENFRETVLQNVKHRTGNSSSSNIQIADLKGVPAIVFIIEKCRMGDTFPSSCVCFDLRSRYLQPVKDFTSIIQDVGRAFGYGERPFLLLSPEADEFLEKIWNNESEGISWENLKKLLDVNLGKNMKRKQETKNKCDKFARMRQANFYSQRQNFISEIIFSDLREVDNESLDEWNNPENDETETEQPEEIVRLFQEIYQADPKQPVFLYNLNLSEETFKHRIILKAEPQIGKTGSFIHLILELCKLLRPEETASKPLQFKNLVELTKEFYEERTTANIKSMFSTPEGKLKYRYYMKEIQKKREIRKNNGILEPSEWAAFCVVDDLKKNNSGLTFSFCYLT